jgi:hypothetical protein
MAWRQITGFEMLQNRIAVRYRVSRIETVARVLPRELRKILYLFIVEHSENLSADLGKLVEDWPTAGQETSPARLDQVQRAGVRVEVLEELDHPRIE